MIHVGNFFRNSFMYSGAAIWNSLPLHVKNATSVNTFKSFISTMETLKRPLTH